MNVPDFSQLFECQQSMDGDLGLGHFEKQKVPCSLGNPADGMSVTTDCSYLGVRPNGGCQQSMDGDLGPGYSEKQNIIPYGLGNPLDGYAIQKRSAWLEQTDSYQHSFKDKDVPVSTDVFKYKDSNEVLTLSTDNDSFYDQTHVLHDHKRKYSGEEANQSSSPLLQKKILKLNNERQASKLEEPLPQKSQTDQLEESLRNWNESRQFLNETNVAFTFDEKLTEDDIRWVAASFSGNNKVKPEKFKEMKLILKKHTKRFHPNEVLIPLQFKERADIVKILGVYICSSYVVIVMKDAGPSLKEVLAHHPNFKRYCQENISDVLENLCRLVDSLNRCGISHNDIKPDNICVTQEENFTFTLVLIDFEAAYTTYDDPTLKPRVTPEYIPPSQIKAFLDGSCSGPGLYRDKVDFWATALTVCYLMLGIHPYFATRVCDYNCRNDMIDGTIKREYLEQILETVTDQWVDNVLFPKLQLKNKSKAFNELLRSKLIIDQSKMEIELMWGVRTKPFGEMLNLKDTSKVSHLELLSLTNSFAKPHQPELKSMSSNKDMELGLPNSYQRFREPHQISQKQADVSAPCQNDFIDTIKMKQSESALLVGRSSQLSNRISQVQVKTQETFPACIQNRSSQARCEPQKMHVSQVSGQAVAYMEVMPETYDQNNLCPFLPTSQQTDVFNSNGQAGPFHHRISLEQVKTQESVPAHNQDQSSQAARYKKVMPETYDQEDNLCSFLPPSQQTDVFNTHGQARPFYHRISQEQVKTQESVPAHNQDQSSQARYVPQQMYVSQASRQAARYKKVMPETYDQEDNLCSFLPSSQQIGVFQTNGHAGPSTEHNNLTSAKLEETWPTKRNAEKEVPQIFPQVLVKDSKLQLVFPPPTNQQVGPSSSQGQSNLSRVKCPISPKVGSQVSHKQADLTASGQNDISQALKIKKPEPVLGFTGKILH